MLLGTDTAQPDLDFESTTFPAVDVVDATGTSRRRSSIDAQDVPGHQRLVRRHRLGPARDRVHARRRARARRRQNSEDVLVVDARARRRGRAAAPAPGSHARGHRAVAPTTSSRSSTSATRTTSAVRARSIAPATSRSSVDGATIPRSRTDPMPARASRSASTCSTRRTATRTPITRNHWVACATLPHRGPQRRGDVALRAGPARHADERGRHARHGLPVPHRRSQQGPGLLADDQRRAGRRVRSGRSDRRRCSTRSPRTSTTRIPLPDPADDGPDARRARRGDLPESAGCSTCHSGPRFTDSAPATPRSISAARCCSTTSARA